MCFGLEQQPPTGPLSLLYMHKLNFQTGKELSNVPLCKCHTSARISQPGVIKPRKHVFEFRAICCRGGYESSIDLPA